MKIYVADKECGNFIDEVATVEEGRAVIEEYEKEDKKNGCYVPDFYNLVDENHCDIE